MAESRGIRAGRAYVEASLSTDKLKKGMEAASKMLQSWGAALTSLGTKAIAGGLAILTPLAGASKVFADIGSDLVDMADRTGLSVEALSELRYAADQTGTSMEGLEKGVRTMQRSILDLELGLSTAEDGFAELNLTLADLKGLGPERQFKLIADRLSLIEDPSRRAAVAMKVLGTAGTELLPLLNNGAKGIEDLQAAARSLGLTISTRDAVAAEAFGDQLSAMWMVLKQNVFVIGSALAPSLGKVVGWVTKAAVATAAWIKENRGLVNIALAVGAALVATGGALIGFGVALTVAGKALGAFSATFGILKTVAGALAPVLGGLLSPMGLLVAGAAAFGTYLVIASGAGGRAIEWLSDRFAGLKDTAITAFRGISAALAKGDIALAGQILWTSLKLVWQQGLLELQKLIPDVGRSFDAMGEGLLEMWITVGGALSRTWVSVMSHIRETTYKALDAMVGGFETFMEAVRPAALGLAKTFARIWARLTTDLSDEEIEQHINATVDDNLTQVQAGVKAKAAELRKLLQGNADAEAKDREKALSKSLEEQRAKLADLQRIRDDRDAEATNRRLAAIKKTEEKIKRLQAELGKLVEQANTPGDEGAPTKPPAAPNFDVNASLRSAARLAAPIGTFSARDASRLGLSGPFDQIAKNTKKTADEAQRTNETLRRMENSDLRFA